MQRGVCGTPNGPALGEPREAVWIRGRQISVCDTGVSGLGWDQEKLLKGM